MNYIKFTFLSINQSVNDELTAVLSEIGFTGFEETTTSLIGYIEETIFNESNFLSLANRFHLKYDKELIPSQNWNALWESNFEPVIIDNICTIKADFHTIASQTPYEIFITPKMSFGTGHHSTTKLMIKMMHDLDFKDCNVLDFGTGTGVLAIFAKMLGAKSVLAIDIDEWSINNAIENIAFNNCSNINILQSTISEISEETYNIILANINRTILIENMHYIYSRLITGGKLLMSGLLIDDKDIITNVAVEAGFELKLDMEETNWIALLFEKVS